MKNCCITFEYIDIVDKISGPDVSNQKGRKMKQIPKEIVYDIFVILIEVIEKNQDMILPGDIISINQ